MTCRQKLNQQRPKQPDLTQLFYSPQTAAELWPNSATRDPSSPAEEAQESIMEHMERIKNLHQK